MNRLDRLLARVRDALPLLLGALPALWLVLPGLLDPDTVTGHAGAGTYARLHALRAAAGGPLPVGFPGNDAPATLVGADRVAGAFAGVLSPAAAWEALGALALIASLVACVLLARARSADLWTRGAIVALCTSGPAIVAALSSGEPLHAWALVLPAVARGPYGVVLGALAGLLAPAWALPGALVAGVYGLSGLLLLGRGAPPPATPPGPDASDPDVRAPFASPAAWPLFAGAAALAAALLAAVPDGQPVLPGALLASSVDPIPPLRFPGVPLGGFGLIVAALLATREASRPFAVGVALAAAGALSPWGGDRLLLAVPPLLALGLTEALARHGTDAARSSPLAAQAPAAAAPDPSHEHVVVHSALAVLAAALVVSEGVSAVPRAELAVPRVAAVAAEGPVLDLPLSRAEAMTALWWQGAHGQPVAPDARGQARPEVMAAARALTEGECPDLGAIGFRRVVARRTGELRSIDALTRCLGPADADDGAVARWEVRR